MKNQLTTDPTFSTASSGAPLLPDYIFYKFDSLLPGNGFIIQDENDPHSLYYKLLQEKGDTFSWEYLEIGPKKWSIKISKRESDARSQTLGEMAVADHRKAIILRKYGLDFSFKGKQNLREACADKGISIKNIERELNGSEQQPLVYTINYNNWELDYLADFIVSNHHDYSRKSLLKIADSCEKSNKLMHQKYSILRPVFNAINQLNIQMNSLLLHEEQVLFPYIRFLVQVIKGRIAGTTLRPGSISELINQIEDQHQQLHERIQFIRDFTNNYRLPNIEYSFYNQVLQALNELDNDLSQHIHIENNILFPKAIKLEQEYLAYSQHRNDVLQKSNLPIDHLSSLL